MNIYDYIVVTIKCLTINLNFTYSSKTPSTIQRYTDGTPHFKFKQSFDINVYFEDIQSINAKLKLYEKSGVESVAFWRISQEQTTLWQQLKIKNR